MNDIPQDAETLKKDVENAGHDEVAAVVAVAETDKKALEITAKAHINTIWQTIESWTVEKLEAFIADLKKHV